MGFNEPLFLLYLLPIFVVIYHLLGRTEWGRLGTLLAISIAFYFWAEPRFVPLVLFSSALDFRLAKYLSPLKKSRFRDALLAVGVGQNLAILFFYKYFDFIIYNLNIVFHSVLVPLKIVLPIGVSFIVFEKISYLVDVSRGTCPPARRIRDYLLFVFLFPKLLAGPILKYHEMRDQILNPPFSITGKPNRWVRTFRTRRHKESATSRSTWCLRRSGLCHNADWAGLQRGLVRAALFHSTNLF